MKKKLLAALLAVCMVASMMLVPAMAADEGAFTDVSGDHWASDAIERWAGYGVLNGHDNGTFNPDGPMTRAQFAKFIVTLMGLPTGSTEMPFEDVMGSADEWAAPYIAAAHKAGIINGKSTTRFAPRDDVSFDQSAAMMARAVGLVDKDAYGDKVTEKLTELGMLDDNVKPDAEPTRALVAGLADNMIGTYVTEATLDEVAPEGVIAGEIPSGIILVVASEGLAVEIKDVTTTAPIVLQGGHVTLTNTTAPSVKVSGGNANIEIDKDSTVDSVTVDGTNASLKVDGTVANVTVTADATISHLEGEGVSKDNVTNNTGAEIEVNGETVAPTPAEPENPDDEQGESTGFVPTPSKPAQPPKVDESKPDADSQKETTKDDAGNVVPGDTVCKNHVWGDKVTASCVAATCTTDGKDVYKCTGKVTVTETDEETGAKTTKEVDCTAVKEVTVPKLGHKMYLLETDVTAAKCTAAGKAIHHCANGSCAYTEEESIAALGHHLVNLPAKAATAGEAGNTAGIYCDRENCDGTKKNIAGKNVYWAVEAKVIPATGGGETPDPSPTAEPTPTPASAPTAEPTTTPEPEATGK